MRQGFLYDLACVARSFGWPGFGGVSSGFMPAILLGNYWMESQDFEVNYGCFTEKCWRFPSPASNRRLLRAILLYVARVCSCLLSPSGVAHCAYGTS